MFEDASVPKKLELGDGHVQGAACQVLADVVDDLSQEVYEDYEKDGRLELDSVAHTPFEIQEKLICDILDFFASECSLSEVILLRHRELVVVIVDVLISFLGAVARLCICLCRIFCGLGLIDRFRNFTCVDSLTI